PKRRDRQPFPLCRYQLHTAGGGGEKGQRGSAERVCFEKLIQTSGDERHRVSPVYGQEIKGGCDSRRRDTADHRRPSGLSCPPAWRSGRSCGGFQHGVGSRCFLPDDSLRRGHCGEKSNGGADSTADDGTILFARRKGCARSRMGYFITVLIPQGRLFLALVLRSYRLLRNFHLD